jgi:hypothetical protein
MVPGLYGNQEMKSTECCSVNAKRPMIRDFLFGHTQTLSFTYCTCTITRTDAHCEVAACSWQLLSQSARRVSKINKQYGMWISPLKQQTNDACKITQHHCACPCATCMGRKQGTKAKEEKTHAQAIERHFS